MMTGMVRSGCYVDTKKKKACDQGLPPDDIFFELTSQNAHLPQIHACQTHRQAPQFSLFFFNEELEEKYLQCSTGLKCTYLKIGCQGVQVAHGRDGFIRKLSHAAAFIISLKRGPPTRSCCPPHQELLPPPHQELLPISAPINCFAPPPGGTVKQQSTAGLLEEMWW